MRASAHPSVPESVGVRARAPQGLQQNARERVQRQSPGSPTVPRKLIKKLGPTRPPPEVAEMFEQARTCHL
eukprot:12885594-Prorocentrum_lima.AAC.1